MVQSVTLSSMRSAIVGQNEDLKEKTIKMFNFLFEKWGYLCVCLSLCVIEC